MNASILQQQLAAITALTIGLTEMVAALYREQTEIAEKLQSVLPNDDGVIRLLSRLEQKQAEIADLQANVETVKRGLRDTGLMP